MKKILALVTTACMMIMILSSGIEAFAYEIPHAFWAMNSGYEQALNSGNSEGIVNYGNQIINLMSGEPDNSEKREILLSRYTEVARAYADLGDWDFSAYTYNLLCGYANYCGQYDRAKVAKAYAEQYKTDIRMYTDKGTAPYFGAKNEKYNGVLFGVCSNGEIRNELPYESMVLTYQELGQSLIGHNIKVLREASENDCAVEFALNCPREAADINNIQGMTQYLSEISDLFNEYPSVPIYLRFAAEFDVWTNMADPSAYKEAFRYVSQYFKSRNPSVAIVWSPNCVSNGHINIDDFYPGDEYVDWVGMALYAQRYFKGDKSQPSENAVLFKSGPNSNPVLAAKKIIENYGNRKPIMISESGCGHYVYTEWEDTTGFALQRLKEYYSYLPMVYPQIKLMAYFDYYGGSEPNNFSLSANAALKSEYLRIIKGSRFIKNGFSNNTDFCYREVGDGTYVDSVFPVSCYAHMYGETINNVVYSIDGAYVGMSSELPFTTYIDASNYPGAHTLMATVTFTNGRTLTTETAINIGAGSGEISVEISGKRILFDQAPVLYNDRTMVPMRKIFEELGADVSWDEATQTASGRRGDKTIRITVGSNIMYVNNTEVKLDAPAIVLSDRVLVPARAVAEGMNCNVNWNEAISLVSISN